MAVSPDTTAIDLKSTKTFSNCVFFFCYLFSGLNKEDVRESGFFFGRKSYGQLSNPCAGEFGDISKADSGVKQNRV
ncbi:hypothetical protein C5167_009574 [Papaver somniferum]|uniref:Uncharacterized protein n=1 Tax=Papaver somniferum TaxID=3469 RepID=A0A4Y7JZ85_PAPSO|nr:hypothetical protein C5167_009574 [Papaver somniferum]